MACPPWYACENRQSRSRTAELVDVTELARELLTKEPAGAGASVLWKFSTWALAKAASTVTDLNR